MPKPNANRVRSYNGDYMLEGKYAEEVTLAFLKDIPSIIGVEDFRELRSFHETDIDCAIKTIDGRVTLAEIKSDRHLGISGNVLFEVLRINHTCQPDKAGYLGWSLRSPATYFLYFAPILEKLYQCRVCELRRSFQRYTRENRGTVKIQWINTDSIKSTLAILLPWASCNEIFTIHDISGYCEFVAASSSDFEKLRAHFLQIRTINLNDHSQLQLSF